MGNKNITKRIMKKIIRLTESDLLRIVEQVIEEQAFLGKLFTLGSKSVKPLIKKTPKIVNKISTRPLVNQLSSKVESLLYKLPEKLKVGPKFETAFSKSQNDIISLEGSLGNLSDNFTEFGTSYNLMKKIKKTMSSPKGTIINLKELYQEVHLVKKDLENLKDVIRNKKSPTLNKMNVKDVDRFFSGNEGNINRIIYNLDAIIKDGSQYMKK